MKTKRVAAFLLAALFAFLPLAGCSAPSGFTVLAESIPENLDPQLASTAAEKTAVVNLFQGLYRRAEDGTAVPAAAQRVEISNDGTTYTFTLHQDMYWDTYRKNGQQVTPEVTADDFVFAFERIFDIHTGSPWTGEFSNIKAVEAPDAHTLVIRLSLPDPSFPLRLTGAGAMPCNREFFEYAAGAYGLSYSYLLTNGPFSIYAWQSGERLVLARDTDVRGLVNTVTFSAPEADDTRGFAERYAAGEGSGAMTSAAEGESNAWTLTTWALLLNCRHSFLADADVRAALASAALGGGPAAGGLVPPGVSAGEKGYREAAGEVYTLLQSPGTVMREAVTHWAGESGGEGFAAAPTLTVLVPDSAPLPELFDEINERWQRQLSCFFSVEHLGLEGLQARVQAGDYDIALAPLYAPSDSAADMLTAFTAGGVTGWQDGTFDAFVTLSQASKNEAAALTAAIEAESLLLAQWPVIPLFYETNSFATDAEYGGLSVYPFGPVLDFSAPAPTGGESESDTI